MSTAQRMLVRWLAVALIAAGLGAIGSLAGLGEGVAYLGMFMLLAGGAFLGLTLRLAPFSLIGRREPSEIREALDEQFGVGYGRAIYLAVAGAGLAFGGFAGQPIFTLPAGVAGVAALILAAGPPGDGPRDIQ